MSLEEFLSCKHDIDMNTSMTRLYCLKCGQDKNVIDYVEALRKERDEAVVFVELFSNLFDEDLGLWSFGEMLCPAEETKAYPHIEKAKEFLKKLKHSQLSEIKE